MVLCNPFILVCLCAELWGGRTNQQEHTEAVFKVIVWPVFDGCNINTGHKEVPCFSSEVQYELTNMNRVLHMIVKYKNTNTI